MVRHVLGESNCPDLIVAVENALDKNNCFGSMMVVTCDFGCMLGARKDEVPQLTHYPKDQECSYKIGVTEPCEEAIYTHNLVDRVATADVLH